MHVGHVHVPRLGRYAGQEGGLVEHLVLGHQEMFEVEDGVEPELSR